MNDYKEAQMKYIIIALGLSYMIACGGASDLNNDLYHAPSGNETPSQNEPSPEPTIVANDAGAAPDAEQDTSPIPSPDAALPGCAPPAPAPNGDCGRKPCF